MSNNDKINIEECNDIIKKANEELKNKRKIEGFRYIEEDLENKYIHEKVAKEEVEELLENSISKDKIREKIEEIKQEYEIALEENSTKAFILKCQIEILQELLTE